MFTVQWAVKNQETSSESPGPAFPLNTYECKLSLEKKGNKVGCRCQSKKETSVSFGLFLESALPALGSRFASIFHKGRPQCAEAPVMCICVCECLCTRVCGRRGHGVRKVVFMRMQHRSVIWLIYGLIAPVLL